MGLLNLFKRKEIEFEKKCLYDGPAYLKGNYRDISKELINIHRENEKENTWIRQIVSKNSNTFFEIKYYGNIYDDHLITSNNDLPQKVVLIDINTKEEILLFDGAKHGYDSVFWFEHPEKVNEREINNTYNLKGDTEFEIVVKVGYNPHFKEEFDEDLNADGFIENQRGEKLGAEAFLDGFDTIDVFAFTKDGQGVVILAEETA